MYRYYVRPIFKWNITKKKKLVWSTSIWLTCILEHTDVKNSTENKEYRIRNNVNHLLNTVPVPVYKMNISVSN